MRRMLLGLGVALVLVGCGGDDGDGGAPATGGADAGLGGSAGSSTGGSAGGGGQSGSGGSGGGQAGSGGQAGAAGSGGSGGVTPPPYDVNASKRQGCQFGSGLLTTETVGPNVPHGDALPFDHVVVLMLENRSFDHYFSELPKAGVTDVDVATDQDFNVDPTNQQKIFRYHETRYCIEDTNHEWDGSHEQYGDGKMDGFVASNNPGGARAMGYYTEQDLPFYYWMAKTFSISDRHFCSLLGPTWPNRFFFYGATAWGNTKTEEINPITADTFKTATKITDQMVNAGKTWRIYRDGLVSFATVWGLTTENIGVPLTQLATDVQNDTLPDLVIIDPNFTGAGQNDEHPPSNIQLGQKLTSNVYATLTSNPAVWQKTVFIVTYDEHGGYYDHVPPPPACQPDNLLPPTGKYDRLGFRVPLLVASPYVKKGYVSHFVTDLTSVTRFIQNRFDLPSMTVRDSNAWPMLDMFDFGNPPFATPPGGAPSADPDPAGVQWCANNPPGTGKP
ncbi:MAG: hypothetical protein KC776_07475 [Myxococcales bacterium]|nr:hypothetical protein [Myxococcales bacterium]MCB9583096.1 hypothetical protein [Polyangiaceae bacterium]